MLCSAHPTSADRYVSHITNVFLIASKRSAGETEKQRRLDALDLKLKNTELKLVGNKH